MPLGTNGVTGNHIIIIQGYPEVGG